MSWFNDTMKRFVAAITIGALAALAVVAGASRMWPDRAPVAAAPASSAAPSGKMKAIGPGADYTYGSGTLTAPWTGVAGTYPDAGVAQVVVGTTTMADVAIVVTGSFTGSIVFEATSDGTNWFPAPCAPLGGGTAVSTVTADGQWVFQVGGLVQFRARLASLGDAGSPPTVTLSASAVGGNTQNAVATPQSQQWIAWQKQADGGAQALLPVWSTSLAVPTNGAVDVAPDAGTGWICVTTSACTTSDAGAGPSTADAGVTDGTCTYAGCWAGTYCPGGVTVVDTDSSNAALVGNAQVQLMPAPPNYGSVNGPLPKDPSTIYVKSTAGTPVLTVGCFQ